jgi:hypothetical protein
VQPLFVFRLQARRVFVSETGVSLTEQLRRYVDWSLNDGGCRAADLGCGWGST